MYLVLIALAMSMLLVQYRGTFHAKVTPKICQAYANMLKYCIENGKDPGGRSLIFNEDSANEIHLQ